MLTPHDPDDRVERRGAVEDLERIAAAGWPTPERGNLGDWLLRAAGGWTARGNSTLPIGEPGRSLPAAVDHVEKWYAQRGLPPSITVPEPLGERLTPELRRRGWVPSPPTLVRTASLASVTTSAGRVAEVRLDRTPPEGWLAAISRMPRGLPAMAHQILTGVPKRRFAGVYRPDGSALAVARGVIADDGDWLGLSLLEVSPAARRQGLATSIVGALSTWAAGSGAHRMYLQVLEHNEPANRLYERLGLDVHHRYATWHPA